MRVAVVRTQVPFIHGGAERHAANLVRALEEAGHEAVEVTVPFKWYPGGTLVDHVMAAKLIDLERFEGSPIDLMIGLKFPAWLARHPNRVFWVLHQHRQAYDMWDAGTSDLLHEPEGVAIRELIRAEDREALGAPGARVFANSGNVAGRLRRYLGIASRPLYHPPPNAAILRPGECGDYLLAPGRIGPMKRQGLMLEALAASRTRPRLVVIGAPDSPTYLEELKERAAALGVSDRVEWRGAVSDDELVRAYAGARAVLYTPVDEDYGYVTLEAMLAGKALVVTSDSGGPLEFVRDGVEGRVVDPEAAALARAIDEAMEDRDAAERMGAEGLARYRAMDISWEAAVAVLTGAAGSGPVGETMAAASAAPSRVEVPAPTAPARQVATQAGAVSAVGPSAAVSEPPSAPSPEPAASVVAGDAAEAPAPAAPPGPDMEALKALLTPPVPRELPFENMASLIAWHDFGTYPVEPEPDAAVEPYFETHWRRYTATLALVEDRPPRRVLDVGVFPPFLFQALLVHRFPGVELAGVWEGPQPFAQTVRASGARGRDFRMALLPANVERDPLPHPDRSFDLVLAMEILEHFAVDPLHFAVEAWRVLEPGGRLVVTTPNVVSHRGALKALQGRSPYSFGSFVPTGGVYGRHNREWTPREVAALGEAAGFETERLLTADVYEDWIDPEIAALLVARGDDFALRGENILYVGRKPVDAGAEPPDRPLPEGFYHGDPRGLAGQVRLVARDPLTGRAEVAARNLSRMGWPAEGPGAVVLYLEWSGAGGELVHGGAMVWLDAPLRPGEETRAVLQLDAGTPEGTVGTLSVELLQLGAGRLSGAGRANRVTLPCSEAAFLSLARAGREEDRRRRRAARERGA